MRDEQKESYHYADIEMEGSEDAGVVIPPRVPKNTSESELTPNEKVKRFIESFQMTTGEKSFVQQARELVDYVESEAHYVPCSSYWPQYDRLTETQRAWYFYWRNEVRYERYTRTDLSYIFLYVYELINGVGWKDPQDGCYMLMEIWRTYRGDFPKLDDYMGDWIADFVFVHRLDIPYRELAERVPHGIAGSKDLFELEVMNRLQTEPLSLTFELVVLLSDYQVTKSKFYTGGGRLDLELYIPKVLVLVDRYMVKMQGQRMVELFHPGQVEQRDRYLFRGALYDASQHGKLVTIGVVPISTYGPLRAMITQLVRITENVLRRLRGFKGKLRIEQVDAGVSTLIERYLEREFGVVTTERSLVDSTVQQLEQKRVEVSIDAEKLAQLQVDSNQVREMLTVVETEVELAVGTKSHKLQEGRMEETSGEEESEKIEQMERVDLRESIAQKERTSSLLVADSVQHTSDECVTRSNANQEVMPETVVGCPVDMSMLDEEWRSFANRLQTAHLSILKEYVHDNGMAIQGALYAIASEHGTMPELLIEQINDASMETLGDLVIDEDGLVDEYRSTLERWMG